MQSKSDGLWITASTKRSNQMNEYEFTLKFAVESQDTEAMLNRLYEAGCDDAIVGTGQPSRIALNFTRMAESAEAAISSAISNVKTAIPEATLIEATPDFVGVTDIADILGCSRQNVRKLVVGHRATFPNPVHDGASAIWHLASVLPWFMAKGNFRVDERVAQVADINMKINIAREVKAVADFERFIM